MSAGDFFHHCLRGIDDMGSSQHGLSVSSDGCIWGSDSHNDISSFYLTWMDWECLSLPSLSIVENK